MDKTPDPVKIGAPYKDDLDLQTVIGNIQSNGVPLIHIHSGSTSEMKLYQGYWANLTGGGVEAYDFGDTSEIVSAITDMVNKDLKEQYLNSNLGYTETKPKEVE